MLYIYIGMSTAEEDVLIIQDNIQTDVIKEKSSGVGVMIENVKAQDGYIQMSDITAPTNPPSGQARLFKKTGSNGLFWLSGPGGVEVDMSDNGETNDVLSAGGTSIFKEKSSTDLVFKGIGATSTKITLVGNTNTVDIDVDESNLSLPNIGGTLTLAKGGTGQTTKTTAFDALAPPTTKGDLIVYNGTTNIRVPVGADAQTLIADSAEASGVRWETIDDGGGSAVVQARKTFAHNITGTWTTITFDATDVETNASVIEHDNTNTGRINILEAGLYEVYYSVDGIATSGTFHDIHTQVLINGVTVMDGSETSGSSYGTNGAIASSATKSIVYDFSASDYVILQVEFDTGGVSGTTRFDPIFRVKKFDSVGQTGPSGPPGAGSSVVCKDEGVNVVNTPHTELNFVGDGVIVTDGGSGVATITIQPTGAKHFGSSSVNPGSGVAGDKYYNTVLNQEMYFDGSRSKWLSVSVYFEGFGVNGNTNASAFYRRFNGMVTSATKGPVVPNATITTISFNNSSSVAHTLEILMNGSVITELASGGASTIYDDSVDVDVSLGIMAARNKTGSSTTNGFQTTIQYRLRI
jgi:hypothetical protein